MILPNDILLRDTPSGTTVWISQRLVVEVFCLSDEYLRKIRALYKQSLPISWQKPSDGGEFLLGDSGKGWRWGRKNGQYYYDIDRIPNRKPCFYRDMLPTKDDLVAHVDENRLRASRERKIEQRSAIMDQVKALLSQDSLTYFLNYKLDDSISIYNADKARQLTQSAAWCRFIKRAMSACEYKEYGFRTQEDFLEACSDILAKEQLEGMRINTIASLRKKVNQAPTGEIDLCRYLVSGKYGNDHRRIVGKHKLIDYETGEIMRFDEHEAVIMTYWLNPGGSTKGTKIELWQRYSSDMYAMGIEPAKLSTFRHYTNTWESKLMSAKERHGKAYFKSTYKPYVPTKPLEFANSLWASDGSGIVPYRYQDHHGKWRTMKVYAMLVSDVASRYIAGYSVSRAGQHYENYKMLRDAMGMALKNNGKTEVLDFISDNHGAYTSAESKAYLQLVCRKYRNIEVGNSQGNYAETMFRLFKRRFKSYFNLPETSWDARGLDSLANPDYYDIMNLPTYKEAIKILETAISEWNNTKLSNGLTPAEWFKIKHNNAEQYTDRHYRLITGEISKLDLSYQRSIMIVERLGVKCKFEVPTDVDSVGILAKHMGYKSSVPVTVYWNESGADIYTNEGVYIFSCEPSRLASKSTSEATHDSLNSWGYNQRKAEAVESMVDDYVEDIQSAKSVLNRSYEFNIADGFTKERYNQQMEDLSAAKWEQSRGKREEKVVTNQRKEDKKAAKEIALQQQRYVDAKFNKIDNY